MDRVLALSAPVAVAAAVASTDAAATVGIGVVVVLSTTPAGGRRVAATRGAREDVIALGERRAGLTVAAAVLAVAGALVVRAVVAAGCDAADAVSPRPPGSAPG